MTPLDIMLDLIFLGKLYEYHFAEVVHVASVDVRTIYHVHLGHTSWF